LSVAQIIAEQKPSQSSPGVGRFLGQALALLKVLRVSRERHYIFALSVGIALVVLLTALGQVWLNTWQGNFYDALARRDLAMFGAELGIFGAIVAFLVVLGVLQAWFRELLKIRLREGLTRDLLAQWLRPRSAYRLTMLGDIGVNPDQRLQEDARHLTELTADLGIGLLQATVLLFSFVGVLWELSDRVTLPIEGRLVHVPGYMVWCALAYAAFGSMLTWFVGRPRIRYNAEHYAREAALRFSLVRVSEAAESIALDGAEEAELRQLGTVFERVLEIMRTLANNMASLTWVQSSYGYIALVVPIVVASPGYFEGTLTFGALIMVAGAFTQVQQSLRWAVDNFPSIADWSATFLRVMTFYEALVSVNRLDRDAPHINVFEHPEDDLEFEELCVVMSDGTATLVEGNVRIGAGERVQIIGTAGTGKALLFRALAGLWTSGSGTLGLPPRDRMMFMPQRPYLPPGPLREVLSYPLPPDTYPRDAVAAALARVGVDRLIKDLEHTENWDRDLTLAEQQNLAIVRVLLHRPRWLVMNEALDTLDDAGRNNLLGILTRELHETAVVSIDTAVLTGPFFTRTLHVKKLPLSEAA